jgi:hypothetical protein
MRRMLQFSDPDLGFPNPKPEVKVLCHGMGWGDSQHFAGHMRGSGAHEVPYSACQKGVRFAGHMRGSKCPILRANGGQTGCVVLWAHERVPVRVHSARAPLASAVGWSSNRVHIPYSACQIGENLCVGARQGPAKHQLSTADLTLTGHAEDAEFALATSAAAPFVASGGKDTNVRRSGWAPASVDRQSSAAPRFLASGGKDANTRRTGWPSLC